MLDEAVIVIDFETTGLRIDLDDRAIEVAALRVVDGQVVDRFESLIGSEARIPKYISRLTGITQSMIDHAPPVAAVIPKLLRFVGETPIVAHNAEFDRQVLRSEARQLALCAPRNRFLCSCKLSQLLYPEFATHALGAMTRRVGIEFSDREHRAAVDAEATVKLFGHLALVLRERYELSRIDVQTVHAFIRSPAFFDATSKVA